MDTSAKGCLPQPEMKNYFGKELMALKVIGVAIKGGNSIAYKMYSTICLLLMHGLYPLLDFAEVFKHDFEVVVSDMLPYLFAAYISLGKCFVVLYNRKTIAKILDRLEEEPFTANVERGGEQEEKMIKKCVLITTVQTCGYWTVSAVTIFFTITHTVILRFRSNDSKDWLLPYGPLTVLNITYSPNFELTWIYQNLSIMAVACNFATIDVLMAAVLIHITGQFKMLQNNLRRIAFNSYSDMRKDLGIHSNPLTYKDEADIAAIPWKYLHKSLKEAVNYHLAILEIAEDMENVFSELMLLIFLGVLGMTSFLIFRASMIHDPRTMLISTSETLVTCFEVACISYWGEQLIYEGHQVGVAAYESNFVGADIRFQKGLALIIRRSQNPVKLTAGKFAYISLATFKWIMRTSYSAFMVLRTNNQQTS